MSFDTKKLLDLLPAIYRIRDAEQGKPLEAILAVIAEQIAVLEEDLERLYDDQFIETCADWVVPYIGDLIGYRPLPTISDKSVSPRAEVAHTIAFRRRKGTAAMLEQLARDVTGWNARVVEFFHLLSVTQQMNHIRPACHFAPDLRNSQSLSRINTAFETVAHTIDVRHIALGDGKYNIANIGVFLWRLQAYPLTQSPASKLRTDDPEDPRYFFSPLGINTPLVTLPETEAEISHLAEPLNVPDPIGRRLLKEQLPNYYGHQKSFAVWLDGTEVPVSTIHVCDLSDVAGEKWAHESPVDKLAIDPVLGRLVLSESMIKKDVRVSFHYAFPDDLGGGEYQRVDSFDAALMKKANSIRVPNDQVTIEAAFASLGDSDGVIEITDSGRYEQSFSVRLKENQKVELRAANKCRPTLILQDDLVLSGESGSELILNGFLIAGRSIRVAGVDNQLSRLTLAHCTLVPGWSLNVDGSPQHPNEASLIIEIAPSQLTMRHCIVGRIRTNAFVQVSIQDCLIDATDQNALAYAASDSGAFGGRLRIESSTVIGRVKTAGLELASNSLFLSPVESERKQEGCLRYSFVPAGSRVPRRFRCEPEWTIQQSLDLAMKKNPHLTTLERKQIAEEIRARLKPGFHSLRYGAPGFGQLRLASPSQILMGADDESEMGVYHRLHQQQRANNLHSRLSEFLRVGLEAGAFYVD